MSNQELLSYELSYWLSPLVPADGLPAALAAGITEPIAAAGGEVVEAPLPKLAPLAYRIDRPASGAAGRQNFRDGYFGVCSFRAAASAVEGLELSWRGSEQIIRFLMIKAPAPAAVRKMPDQTPTKKKTIDDEIDALAKT